MDVNAREGKTQVPYPFLEIKVNPCMKRNGRST
jgi:hypothetical protein